MSTKFEAFKKLLFYDNDKVCYGDKFATTVHSLPDEPSAEFFCINPLAHDVDYTRQSDGSILPKAGNGRRADLNVTRFQNFMFEADNTPLDKQLQYLNECKFPWASITYSGGKSYHAILSLEVPLDVKVHTQQGVDAYKQIWKQLAFVLCARVGQPISLLDSSTQNPSRLSRMPGAWRMMPTNSLEQTLVYLGTLCKEEQLKQLLLEAPEVQSVHNGPRIKIAVHDVTQLDGLFPVELLSRLQFPKYWAQGDAGNYPHLFRLVCWAIDSTGLSKDMMVQFLEKYTFPTLRKMGYPDERMYKPVDHAYEYKGEK